MSKDTKSNKIIDSIDSKILFELGWNCRMPLSEIGKKHKISKQVVKYRVNQLEKNKIILSYHALIDWRRLGYNSIRIYIKWQNITLQKEQEIYNYLKLNPLFMWIVKFEGEVDIGFYIWIKSIPEFYDKWKPFLIKYKKYILKQEIYESVSQIHYPMKVLMDEINYDEKIVGKETAIDYDKLDYKILEILTKKANETSVSIAKKLNLTPKAIIDRIKKLEKNKIILGYNALIDTNKLGYRFYKIDFYLNNLDNLDQINIIAKQHKNVTYRMETIGGPEVEIEVIVKDVAEINKIIKEFRDRFDKDIGYHRIHRLEYTIKQEYLPGKY